MITTIYATLTRCRNHKPLVLLKQLNDQPFSGIAVDPDALKTSARHFMPKHMTVPIKQALAV